MTQEFHREDRYIVIKRSDLKKVPLAYRSRLVDPMFSLLAHLPRRECLVVESDWPEYEPAWTAIEARMTGAAPQPPALGGEHETFQEWWDSLASKWHDPSAKTAAWQGFNAGQAKLAPLKAEIAEWWEHIAELNSNIVELREERDQLKAEAEQLSETSMSQESLIEQLTDSLANHDSVSKVMNAWVAEKGQMPWATTIKTLAIITKMPDQERDRLLNMDDGGTERGALIEERDRLQARCDEQAKTLSALVAVARTVNRNAASETSVPGDDEPQYRQRKEWIEYLLETCAEAEALSRPAGVEQV